MKEDKKIYKEYFYLVKKNFHDKALEIIKEKEKKGKIEDIILLEKNSQLIGGCTLISLSDNIYGILYTVIDPNFRKENNGRELMNLVHDSHKGIFLLRTRNAENFYKKIGYKTFKKSKTHAYMIYMNDFICDF